jgi:hypothetical protein
LRRAQAERDEENKMLLKIKNWQDFQHYKDRAPPWIKLHNTLLTSEVWVMGNDATRALVVASMLLASRNNANDGTFNGDPEYVKRFAYLNSTPDFKPLIQYGFIEVLQDASNMLATCNTEERRGETETDKPKAAFSFKTELLNIGVAAELVADWLAVRKTKKATNTKTALDKFNREVAKSGWTHEQAIRHCVERNWQGFEADWVKEIKPANLAPAIQFDREAYESKRKAEAAAARERMRQEHAEWEARQA